MNVNLLIVLAALSASAGTASAQSYYNQAGPSEVRPGYAQPSYSPCPANYYATAQGCVCRDQVNFYSSNSSGYYPGSGTPPYSAGQGYNVHLYAPGVRVIGQPVEVPSGAVYVEGPPIYVDAPPVHVASPQIYLQRPKVYVKPSQVTVEPPTVHVASCAKGGPCEMVGTSTRYTGERRADYNGMPH